MKTFKLNSERPSVVRQSGDFNSHSSMMTAEHPISDIKSFTQYAPILLSDDEPQITRLYEVLMTRVGLKTVSVPDGDVARDYLLDNPVSLVISDLMKPHFNGLDLLSVLRQNPATTDVPFMIITATPDYESRKAFKSLGGDVYLTKPIDARQLTQIVIQLLSAQLSKQLSQ